ncbi:hypothetical protein [Aquidulcibacter sp.]|jgi:hypothetical protein|uniref:hypothetical protein n=1 Tax=Aquidulcibacter sp. TaxID=2052990 RepID=UPI003782D429
MEDYPAENPEEFLISLGASLLKTKDVDVGLVGILTAHILKAEPAPDAVARAKDAILTLAAERANPLKIGAQNG